MRAVVAIPLAIALTALSSFAAAPRVGTLCIAGFQPVRVLSDRELTNKHPAREKSVFTFKFGRSRSIAVRAREERTVNLPAGRYRVQVLLDGRPVETFTAQLTSNGLCLWYLESSGWQISDLPDPSHGCKCPAGK